MLCIFTLVLTEVRVKCPIWLFFVVPWFLALQVCFPDLTIVPLTPIFSGITFVFTFHTSCISNVRLLLLLLVVVVVVVVVVLY